MAKISSKETEQFWKARSIFAGIIGGSFALFTAPHMFKLAGDPLIALVATSLFSGFVVFLNNKVSDLLKKGAEYAERDRPNDG